MNLINTYLRSPRAQQALSRKPSEAGFSLIELVVVVAVLAILAAIAIPSFTSINNEARVSGAKATLANLVKECAVKLVGSSATATYTLPTLNGYAITATGTAGTCASGNVYTATANTGVLTPTFVVDAGTGAKNCSASAQAGALTLGCNVATGTTAGAW